MSHPSTRELRIHGIPVRPAPHHPGLLTLPWLRPLARHLYGVRVWAGPCGAALYASSLGWRQAQPGATDRSACDEDSWSIIEREEMLKVLGQRARHAPQWPWVLPYCLALAFLHVHLGRHPLSDAQLAAWFALTFAFMAGIAWFDQLRSHIAVYYEVEAGLQRPFQALVHSARLASDIRRLHVLTEPASPDACSPRTLPWDRPDGTPPSARLWLGMPPHICANLEVPLIQADRRVLAFMPDHLLEFTPQALRSIRYADLQVQAWPLQVIETGRVPYDAHQLVTRPAEPKRQPMCRYGVLSLSTPDGWHLQLACSREHALVEFGQALHALGRV